MDSDTDIYDVIQRRLLTCVSAFGCLLFISTWRLWIWPSRPRIWSPDFAHFPQVPLLAGDGNPLVMFDGIAFLVVFGCLVATLFPLKQTPKSACTAAFVAMSLVLIVNDQHRLQPWFYQFVILAVASLLLEPARFVRFARWLLISIYLFSAWSKFDYSFANSLGQQFLDTISEAGGFTMKAWNQNSRATLAMAFPAMELLIGVGLSFVRSQKIAAAFAVVLHLALIGILGPWALDHHVGVLLWNVFFIATVFILFWDNSITKSRVANTTRDWRFVLSTAVLLAPILEPVGLIDHWPAWQLYAPRNSRAGLQLTAESVQQLPRNLIPFVRQNENSPWAYLDIDAWSLKAMNVPSYPQARFQHGVAWYVANHAELGGAAKLTVYSAADRVDGKRTTETFRGTEEIANATQRYRLNAVPRSFVSIDSE